MLSYRHAFHAGNHADVLKHTILVDVLDYMTQKDKPLWVIDTHAGAGLYALTTGYATKLAEYRDGIAKLMQTNNLPEPMQRYLECVRFANADGALSCYPGSPWIARHCVRNTTAARDKLFLFELHPTDHKSLEQNFADSKRQVKVEHSDGLAGLKALLPPQPRRALVLIDPAYELAGEYKDVTRALRDALVRFPSGTYVVWYPQLCKRDSINFPDRLKDVVPRGTSWLHTALSVRAPAPDGFGMHGSGMFIINPPYTLNANMKACLPAMVKHLGQDDGAKFVLEGQQF